MFKIILLLSIAPCTFSSLLAQGTRSNPVNGNRPAIVLTCSYFNVAAKNNEAQVEWTAVSNSSQCYFELEKSDDGRNYTRLTQVYAKGKGEFEYSFTDRNLQLGSSHYRLKLVEAGGSFKYLPAFRLRWKNASVFINNIYPTIASSTVYIQINSDKRINTQLQIFDPSGRFISKTWLSIMPGNNAYPIDISRLPAGNYCISVILNEIATGRFIKR